MTYICFDLDIQDRIAHLRLCRPEQFNTLTPGLFRELRQITDTIDGDATARVIVLSSTGRHFCAGMDHTELTGALSDGTGPESAGQRPRLMLGIRESADAFTALERLRLPVLAAIQGGCMGGGAELAAACDLRYATADAFFALQQINLGFPPDLGALQRLPRLMPEGLVRELAFTGRRMPAAEARTVGFLNQVFDTQEELLAAVMDTAGEIATKAPAGIWGTKDILARAREHTVEDGVAYVALWQAAMLDAGQIAEGVSAFRDKRPPRYDELPPRFIGRS
jgi:enoyl-CoA hydratase